MPLFNFILDHPSDIKPWGAPPASQLHWYALTDGYYWIDTNTGKLYELTPEILLQRNGKWKLPYLYYDISHFAEDLLDVFGMIREPIPDNLYSIVKDAPSLLDFHLEAVKWLDENTTEDDDAHYTDFICEKYDPLVSWISSRTLDYLHLSTQILISFFRYKDKIKLVWNIPDNLNEKGIPIYKYSQGQTEFSYSDFLEEVKSFADRFFNEMDKQIITTITKDWGEIKVNKAEIQQEQVDTKVAYYSKLNDYLNNPVEELTDWKLINELIDEMREK